MPCYNLCASISHWLGNISKLPNQCENTSKNIFHSWKLPNQCEMLAHRVYTSISHWLGSFQNLLGSFQDYQIYQNYLINVNCLCIPYVQAFHIDWAILKMAEWLFLIQCYQISTQSMWNACLYPMCKHFTLIE